MKLRQNNRGFALYVAIFLVVIIAAMAISMSSLVATRHLMGAKEVQGAEAYWAAYSGMQYGIAQAVNNCSCANAALTVDGITVTFTCASVTVEEAGSSSSCAGTPANQYQIYTLQAEARMGGKSSGNLIRRTVGGQVTDAN